MALHIAVTEVIGENDDDVGRAGRVQGAERSQQEEREQDQGFRFDDLAFDDLSASNNRQNDAGGARQ